MSKIIAFVGMPGSGKTTAVDYISTKGYPKVYFGGVVLEELEKRGLERNADNESLARESLRAEEGNDVIAKRIITQIKNLIAAGQHYILADGLYSWTEYKTLKQAFPGELKVIGILAPQSLRHHRLTNRPERPFTVQEAKTRDWHEIEQLEKGGPIVVADHYIVNESNQDDFIAKLEIVLKASGFYE